MTDIRAHARGTVTPAEEPEPEPEWDWEPGDLDYEGSDDDG